MSQQNPDQNRAHLGMTSNATLNQMQQMILQLQQTVQQQQQQMQEHQRSSWGLTVGASPTPTPPVAQVAPAPASVSSTFPNPIYLAHTALQQNPSPPSGTPMATAVQSARDENDATTVSNTEWMEMEQFLEEESTPQADQTQYPFPQLQTKLPPVSLKRKAQPSASAQSLPPLKKHCSPSRIPTNSSRQPVSFSPSKTGAKKQIFIEKDTPSRLSPPSVKMLEEGALKEGHDICEQNGVTVEGTTDPSGATPLEQFSQFANLRHWENHFTLSPLATVHQLMIMGNLFQFFLQAFNKMRGSTLKLMMDIARVKTCELNEQQELDIEAVQNFLQRVESDETFTDSIDEEEPSPSRFQQQCKNCPVHKCGIFTDLVDTGLEEESIKVCTMCSVHKCVCKFNTKCWNFGGRPNQGKSEKKQKISEATEITSKAKKSAKSKVKKSVEK